ncbi:thiamine transporter 2-like isoform X1 [Chiloscyllium plagiosum]|uniref:thiamine transporter 2-like isoform X1 n=2 Tax=Chiloscyllium plagiosum TaxID=36176 RepID=UPI001CB864A6|nr:thiamine transporter 2-like isoform X1 [Chiloscyllium plagiosum]
MSSGCTGAGCWNGTESKQWISTPLLLCVIGFFSMMRPIDSFLVAYVTGPDKNFTVEQIMNEVLPVMTYTYLAVSVPVFLLTDYLKYKPVIVCHCVASAIGMSLTTFGQHVSVMQLSLVCYGITTATAVACFSYIYNVVSLEHYQKVTSYYQSVTLIGCTFGSVLAQVLVTVWSVSYFCLNIISLVSVSVALLFSIFLPMPKRSMFFHKIEKSETIQNPPLPEAVSPVSDSTSSANNMETRTLSHPPVTLDGEVQKQDADGLMKGKGHHSVKDVFVQLWSDFKACYTSPQLLCWSIWWALATAGYLLIVYYMQVLWNHIEPFQNARLYNGGAEAMSNIVGASTSFVIGHVKVNWTMWGELILGIFSAVNSGILYTMALSNHIWVCYAGYVLFKGSYMLLNTVAMFQIAANLEMGHHALVFGINSTVALILQTILTIVVIDSRGLALDIITQVLIWGSYFAAIAGLFLIRGIYTLFTNRRAQIVSTNTSLSRNEREITAL